MNAGGLAKLLISHAERNLLSENGSRNRLDFVFIGFFRVTEGE